MANITQTTADVFIQEHWADELNKAVKFLLVIADLFSDWTSKMRGGGDVLHLPSDHNLTANTKTASIDATPEAITETQQNFTVSTHQIVAQTVEDFAEVMSKYDIRSGFTSKAAYALSRALEVSCAALLDDNTTQTVGTLGAELSDDDFIQAWQLLMEAGGAVPPFKGVVSVACWGGMLKIGSSSRLSTTAIPREGLYTRRRSGKSITRRCTNQT